MTRLSAKTLNIAPASSTEVLVSNLASLHRQLKSMLNAVVVYVSGVPRLNSSIVMEPGSAGATLGRGQAAKHCLVSYFSLAGVHARSSTEL